MTARERAELAEFVAQIRSENAQAEREVLSRRHRDDDPEPGAFYGLTPPTDPEPTHAEH